MNRGYFFDKYRLVEFYDDIYNYDDDFELWREYIKPGMSILELACGTGRLTRLIVENFENVVVDALDYSKEMLELLKINIKKMKIKPLSKINIIESDMRFYKSNQKYDLIIISSNSLNHIETNEDIEILFQNLYLLLKNGGYLLFDILNPIFSFLVNKNKDWNFPKIYKQRKTNNFFHADEKSIYEYKT